MSALKEEISTDLWSPIIDELHQMLLFTHLKFQHLFSPLFILYYPLKRKKRKKRIDIGCNSAPLTEKEEENGKYTLWSMFNMKITINHNGLLWGSACCVYQGGACVPHRSFTKPKLENGVNIFLLTELSLVFFPVSIRECLSFGMKCISVHKIIWWYLIQRSAYTVFPLLQEPPFCLSSARRGEKKADNVLDANNGCQWHRGWHQTLFV